jgi:hypothetical protein
MTQSASLRRNAGIVKSVPYRRLPISAAGMMSVRHYKRRMADDYTIGIAGCACRGCMAWMNKMRIDQAADALIEAEGGRA